MAPSATPRKQSIDPALWKQVVDACYTAYRAKHHQDPNPEGPDWKALKAVVAKHGAGAVALVQAFVADDDRHVASRGWVLRDLPGRVQALLLKAPKATAPEACVYGCGKPLGNGAIIRTDKGPAHMACRDAAEGR